MINVCVPTNNTHKLIRFLMSPVSASEIRKLGPLCVAFNCGVGDELDVGACFSLAEKLGIELRSNFDVVDGVPSMCALRRRSLLLADCGRPSLLVDDNIELKRGAAAYFESSVEKSKDYPNAGAIFHLGAYGAGPYSDDLRNFNSSMPATGHGILWLGNPRGAFLENQDNLLGGAEELIVAANANVAGKHLLRRFFAPVSHHELRGKTLSSGSSCDLIHDLDVAKQNVFLEVARLLRLPRYEYGQSGVFDRRDFVGEIPKIPLRLIRERNPETWNSSYGSGKRSRIGPVLFDGVVFQKLSDVVDVSNPAAIRRFQKIRAALRKDGVATYDGKQIRLANRNDQAT